MKNNVKFIFNIFLIGFIIFFINQYFFQICFIQGESMSPTLKKDSMILIKKFDLSINYNDIVVIKKKNKTIIKRVVGLPNDSIKIDKYLYINGNKKDDSYIEEAGEIKKEILLRENEFFVLGDNIQNSIDSRFSEIGIIKKDEIIGQMIQF